MEQTWGPQSFHGEWGKLHLTARKKKKRELGFKGGLRSSRPEMHALDFMKLRQSHTQQSDLNFLSLELSGVGILIDNMITFDSFVIASLLLS